MKKIAGVRFRDNWKVYDFEATGLDLAVGDKVIVDSERGQGFAVVVRLRMQAGAPEPEPVQMEQGLQVEQEGGEDAGGDTTGKEGKSLRKILRKVSEDDLGREGKNREREREAFKTAQDIITERDLPMKLIRVEFSFDASRAVFFFFSETRVDFRDLVKDLAFKLRSRIEMRQIGVRDVARIIGGFGPCGRELCCTAFLKNFEPVSIRMAKKQDMVLNPAKISGVCGRLLCCLSYEYGMYDEIKKDLAGMREAAVQEKRDEEERRITEERKDAEDRRLAEDKRRQTERKPQEKRDRQKDGGPKDGGRPEKKKEQQEKQPQPRRQQGRDQRQQRPDQQRQQEQKEKAADKVQMPPQPAAQQGQQQAPPQEQQSADADKAGKKKRRRFWRKKKKGGGGAPGGENKPQGPGNA